MPRKNAINTDGPRRSFHLVRHFSITAILSITIAALLLGYLYQASGRSQLTTSEERHHAELSRLFGSLIWPEYGEYLTGIKGETAQDILANPRHDDLHALIQREIADSLIVKIKIFNSDGLTIYSSDTSQIGANKKGYAGFESAKLGRVTSSLSFRESFNRGDHSEILKQRHLVSSYLPIISPDSKDSGFAVFELYSDVTPLMEQIVIGRNKLILVTVAIMLVLFSVLLVNIRHADFILRTQAEEGQQAEIRTRWQANHDALTELPNRRYFKQLLRESTEKLDTADHKITLIFIDLDGFKPINDGLGHSSGDKVLKLVANRIRKALPEGAIVARIGGDEFTVLLPVRSQDYGDFANDCVGNISKAISIPMLVGNREVSIGASFGLTVCEQGCSEPEALIAEADIAMYQAKKNGKGSAYFYSSQLGKNAVHKVEFEQRLRQALKDDVIEAYFQPLLDLQTDAIVGVEALARWPDPGGGFISPAEFIPAAEASGLIVDLDRRIFAKACEKISELRADGYGQLTLSANLSSVHFERDDLIVEVSKILKSSQMPPESIQFELTESVLLQFHDKCDSTLKGLNKLGISVALDDFGTGYSSLNYLRKLSLNTLKIDRSFIADATTSERDAAMVQAIAQLAKSLQMKCIAEGVETQEQLEFIRKCGIDEAQGYLISHALPVNELKQFISDYENRHTIPLRVVGG